MQCNEIVINARSDSDIISFGIHTVGFVTLRWLYLSGSLNFKHDRNSNAIIQSLVHAYEHGGDNIPCTCLSNRLYAAFCAFNREALAPPVSITFPETIMVSVISTETLPSSLGTVFHFAHFQSSLERRIYTINYNNCIEYIYHM